MLLAADVGGTKTNIALAALPATRGALPVPIQKHSYASGDHASLEDVLARFLDDLGPARPSLIEAACFGVAGPVVGGRSETPNLPWVIEAEAIAQRFAIAEVRLVNDLVATAIRAATLGPEDVEVLHAGSGARPGTRVVVAAGTGLGVAQLVDLGGVLLPVPSEGGHICFAPRNREEFALLEFLAERFGRVSLERAVSGPGLSSIYDFIVARGELTPNPELASAVVADRDDAPRHISEYGEADRCPAARRALELFVELYGAAAGNFALMALAEGGVFLGGGIAPKLLRSLRSGRFLEAFFDKGRFRPLMESLPVYVIEDPETALLGAALEAARIAGQHLEAPR